MARSSSPLFEWDEHNEGHIDRHGVTPEEVEQVFANDPVRFGTSLNPESGEIRHREVGETDAGRVLIVIWTPRGRAIRAVTAWPASRRLRRVYRETRSD